MKQVDICQFLSDTNLGSYAGKVAESSQFPPQTTALMAIGVASQIVSLAVSVAYSNGKPLPSGLLCVGEQTSGAAKSRVLGAFRGHFEASVKRSNDEKAIKRKSIEARLKNEKREMMEVEQKEYARNCPVSVGLKSATIESVESVAFKQGGFFALASSEKGLINTLLGLAYGDANRKSCDDLLLNGYDGDYYEVGRVNAERNGAAYVYGSMAIIAQDGVIDSLIVKSDGSGLAERVMFLAERGLMGGRDWFKMLLPDDHRTLETLELQYNARVDEILELANTRENMEIHSLIKTKISKKAWKLIAEYMNENEHKVGYRGQYENSVLSGAYSKKVPNIMKLAVTLYLFEVDTKGDSLRNYIANHKTIPDVYVEKAMQVIDQVFTGMVYLCETKGVSGNDREVEAVTAWLCKGKGRFFKESEIKRSLRNTQPFKSMETNDRSDAITIALGKSVKSGEVHQSISGNVTSYRVF